MNNVNDLLSYSQFEKMDTSISKKGDKVLWDDILPKKHLTKPTSIYNKTQNNPNKKYEIVI